MNIIEADYGLFSLINGCHFVPLDKLMEFISSRGAAIPMYVLMALFLYKKYQSKFWWIFGAVILLIVLSDQISVGVKFYVERLRPCHDDLLTNTIHLVNNKCGGQFGFYSSHASNTAALSFFFTAIHTKQIHPFNPLRLGIFGWLQPHLPRSSFSMRCFSGLDDGLHFGLDNGAFHD